MKKKLLFVTGFQKSGTSVLNRALMYQTFIENPFLPEGKYFWGDNPVENPVSSPCGELYQEHGGRKGHQLLESDFRLEHQQLLDKRIKESNIKPPVLMNKNPNLIVRLPWLKKIFPESKIVVVLRDPVANLYSFSKKMHREKNNNLDFWWGVKPNKWQKLIKPNPLEQIVFQWKAVFEFLIRHTNCVDLFIDYSSFCQDPYNQMVRISNLINIDSNHVILPFENLTCMDSEYKNGGNLESKNILLRRDKTFEITQKNLSEKSYNPFTSNEVDYIKTETSDIWRRLRNKVNGKL